MNTLKSLVVFAVLGVIGYAVYLGLTGELNLSMGLPADSGPDGDAWNTDVPPPPLADATDQYAHHEPGEHSDNTHGKSTPLTPSSTGPSNTEPSVRPLAKSSTYSPPAATAAPAAYRQDVEPAPYSPKSSITSTDPTSTNSTGPSAAPTSDMAPVSGSFAKTSSSSTSASTDSPPSPSGITAKITSTTPPGPSAYQSKGLATTDANTTSAALPKSDEDQGPVSMMAADEVGAAYVFESTMKDAQQKIDAGHPEDALFLLSMLHEDEKIDAKHRTKLLALLDQVAGTVVYSREHLMEPAYIVKPNERLADVAQAFDVPPGLLAKINGISTTAPLQPGTSLKVVRGPFNAVINTTSRELTLFVQSRYAGRFPIHVGPQFSMSAGSGAVTSKTRQHPQHPGHPWIGLGSSTATTGQEVGIVGMKDPAAVDSQSSKNIGVTSAHADDLYDILSNKSRVTIVR